MQVTMVCHICCLVVFLAPGKPSVPLNRMNSFPHSTAPPDPSNHLISKLQQRQQITNMCQLNDVHKCQLNETLI